MMRRLILLLVLFLAGDTPGQAQKSEPMRGAKRGEARQPAAILVVAINEAAGNLAGPGWPLIVSATREPDGSDDALPPALRFTLTLSREGGGVVPVVFEPVVRSTPRGEPVVHWLAPETATTQLAPGRYRVTVTPPAGTLTGWRIESGEFTVVAPGAEHASLLGLLKIQRWILLGRDDDALAEADRSIAANPKDTAAWIAKGDLLMKKDDPDAALLAYDRAFDLHRKDEGDPIAILQRRRSAQLRSLEKRGVVTPLSSTP